VVIPKSRAQQRQLRPVFHCDDLFIIAKSNGYGEKQTS
jgi:hypothetical protein